MKKQMSIYSYEKQQWISTDNFGSGYRKIDYILLSTKEFEKFQKEARKGFEKWSFILESGFISTNDIIRCLCQDATLRHTLNYIFRNNRLYVDERLKSSGYYSYKDRNIYKDGSVFWKIDEIEHCFPDIRSQIEVFVDEYTPKEEYWNNEVISLYYGYSRERFFIEEVRKKKVEHDKRMRELEEADEIDVDALMDEIFERVKVRGGHMGSILDEMVSNNDIPRIGLGGK